MTSSHESRNDLVHLQTRWWWWWHSDTFQNYFSQLHQTLYNKINVWFMHECMQHSWHLHGWIWQGWFWNWQVEINSSIIKQVGTVYRPKRQILFWNIIQNPLQYSEKMNKYHIGPSNNHQYDQFTELEVQMSWPAFLNKSIMFYFII